MYIEQYIYAASMRLNVNSFLIINTAYSEEIKTISSEHQTITRKNKNVF
jgi:hypothetical protein